MRELVSSELILIGSDVVKPVSTSTCCFISLADAGKERSSPEKGKKLFLPLPISDPTSCRHQNSRSQFIGEYFFYTSVPPLLSLLSVKVTLNTAGIVLLFGVILAHEDAFSKCVDFFADVVGNKTFFHEIPLFISNLMRLTASCTIV